MLKQKLLNTTQNVDRFEQTKRQKTLTVSVQKDRKNEVYYNLDEASNWSVSAESLIAAYDEAQQEGVDTRSIAVINPGDICNEHLFKIFWP